MYAGFKISLSDSDFSRLSQTTETPAYSAKLASTKSQIKTDLREFMAPDGTLSAKKMQTTWFPLVYSHVFISHSHQDESLAKKLSAWLYNNFKVTSFVDSSVWGYCNELLKSIDDDFCINTNGQTYNYEKRNMSTSHVHMILTSALQAMIDRCECLIFINSDNSINPIKSIEDTSTTYSPWIFAELFSSIIIRRKPVQLHRLGVANESFDDVRKQLTVTYPAPLEHLTEVSINDLLDWQNYVSRKNFITEQSISDQIMATSKLDWFYNKHNVAS